MSLQLYFFLMFSSVCLVLFFLVCVWPCVLFPQHFRCIFLQLVFSIICFLCFLQWHQSFADLNLSHSWSQSLHRDVMPYQFQLPLHLIFKMWCRFTPSILFAMTHHPLLGLVLSEFNQTLFPFLHCLKTSTKSLRGKDRGFHWLDHISKPNFS